MKLLLLLFSLIATAAGLIAPGDQAALATFYASLTQKGSLSWRTDLDLCTEAASGKATDSFVSTVVCDRSAPQRVVQLHLYRKGISGTLPSALNGLTALTHLYLMGNSFSGSLPDLSQLTKLQAINLESNGFNGPIPSFLGSFSDLFQLVLEANSFTGPIPTELGKLSNLQILALSNNNIGGSIPAELGSLTSLTIFSASQANLSGDIPRAIGSIASLQQLDLSENTLTGQIPSELGNSADLFELNLKNNRFSGSLPPELGNLINLVVLEVSNNNISGSIPPSLGNLENLDTLNLGMNAFSGPIPSELGKIPYVTSINLNSNALSGSIPTELGELENIQLLNLGANKLSGSIPESIGNLPSLSHLNLADNQLSGTIPPGLTNPSRFNELLLGGSNATNSSNFFCPLPDYSAAALVSDYQARDCSSCSPVPCYNSGVCRYVNSSFTCLCPTGFNGTNCENQIFCGAVNETGSSWPTSSSQESVVGSCLPGYGGSPTRSCQGNGQWGPISNPCRPQCPTVEYGRAVWPSTFAGSSAIGVCIAGWTGTPVRRCDAAGNWESLINNNCIRMTCPAEFFNYVQWNVTNAGSIVNANCPTGFTGRPSRTCLINGTWTDTTNPCVPPPCPSETYLNATWPSTQSAFTASGTCGLGFSGNPTRLCLASGWSPTVNNPCTRNSCPKVVSGSITWPQTQSLTTVSIACPYGYAGTSSRTCNATGAWQAIVNPCVALPLCPAETLNTISWNATVENSVAVGTCALGEGGAPLRSCLAGGSWNSTVVGACTRNVCPSELEDVVTWPSSLSLTNVTLTCPSNYLGNPSRLCQADGTWSSTLNPCTLQTLCPAELLDDIFWQTTLGTQVVTGVCQAGFGGTPLRICFSSGEWSSSVVGGCNRNMCPSENNTFVEWPSTPSLTNVTLPCPSGFSGNPSRTCDTEGTWGAISSPCEELPHCPMETADGLSWPKTLEGQTVNLSCVVGYSGGMTRLCQLGGAWQAPTGGCTRNTCPLEEEGTTTWPLTDSLATVTFPCGEGFTGALSRTCQADGTWTVTSSTCQSITCAGEVSEGTTWPTADPLETANGVCQDGYSGNPTRTCQQDGSWGSITNPCTRNQCPSESYLNATWPESTSLTTATGTCLPGFMGTPTRTCTINGTWSTMVTNPCVAWKGCPAAIDYAHANWTETRASTVANGTCVAGWSGSPTRRCLSSGAWDSLVQNQCSRITCPAEYFNFVNWPQTLSFNNVLLNCPSGFTGRPYRTCGANGVWGAITNPCICSTNCT